jgi:Cellulase (glycosyl hydrolase family 5)
MKKWHFLLGTLISSLFFGCNSSEVITASAAKAKVVTLGNRGINLLSNLMWSNQSASSYSVTEAARLKSLELEFVRLPIDPIFFMASDDTFGVPANQSSYIPDLDNAIANLTKAGLKVIVDIHSFSDFPGLTPARDFTQSVVCGGQALTRFERFLTSIAKYLGGKDKTKVVLELLNEPYNPNNVGKPCIVNGTAQTSINWAATLERLRKAARAGSNDLTLALSGEDWSGTYRLRDLPVVNDANIIYTVHYYGPLEFSHQGAGWLSPYYRALENVPYPVSKRSLETVWAKVAANIDADSSIGDKTTTKNNGRKALECYYATPASGCNPYAKADINWIFDSEVSAQAKRLTGTTARVYLGEFGVLGQFQKDGKTFNAAPLEDRIAWLTDVRRAAEQNGIGQAMWIYNDPGGFGVFNKNLNPPQLESGILTALGLKLP